MTELDKDETRALARTLVHQLNPSLEGERAKEAERNLMRLAARMAGHVAQAAAESLFDNSPGENLRREISTATVERLAAVTYDTGEELASTYRVKKDEWCDECYRHAQPREALCSGPDSRFCGDSHRCLHCVRSEIRQWDCASCGTPGDVDR